MKIYRAFKYRIYPSEHQIEKMFAWEVVLRYLWNLAHEQRLMRLKRPKGECVRVNFFTQSKELTELRRESTWIEQVPRHIAVSLLKDLDTAWGRCYKKTSRKPRWKKKGRDQVNFTEFDHNTFWMRDGLLKFTGLGKMRVVVDRPLVGVLKSCTISRDVDQWFVSIMVEEEIADPVRNPNNVGVDRGVIKLVADSSGKSVDSPQYHKRAEKSLARAQRQAARKQRGSNNQRKANLNVAKKHRRVRRQREQFIHTLSHDYAKNYGIVVIERLNVCGMTASAAGTSEEPGKNVAQKSGLNRSILDAGWGILRRQLEYKLGWNGGKLVEINPAYTSQECSSCGFIHKGNRRTQEKFECLSCGFIGHADVNAAKVILTRASRSGLLGEDTPSGAQRTKKQPRFRKKSVEKDTREI